MGQTDARTDIYCLGVTLYSLLTGYNPEKPPYKIYPEKYWGEHISLEMKSLLLKCIQSEPEKRYQNCRELAYALSQIDYKKQKEKENERRKIIKFLSWKESSDNIFVVFIIATSFSANACINHS